MEIEKAAAAKLINFEETELRLGLPGGGGGGGVVEKEDVVVVVKNNITNGNGKREFEEAVDLKLKLSSKAVDSTSTSSTVDNNIHKPDPATKPPAAKAQVVGWPPVRSYRKNILAVQKSSVEEVSGNAAFVKVSMDGAPYLRKVDLKMYKSYQDLYDALNKLFVTSFTTTNGMKDFMNENKAMDLLNGSDYVPTYEDKDGDWMLVGDVPWEMFVDTCKRLRIMKGTDAKGLAPRAMEKSKNRS